jgi:hypothetical protein
LKTCLSQKWFAAVIAAVIVLFTANSAMAAEGSTTNTGNSDSWRLGVGPTLGLMSSTVGYGGTVSGEYQLSSLPLSIGLQSGYVRFPASTSVGAGLTLGVNVNLIPVLATATYYLPMQGFTPYLGVGVGVSITPTSASLGGASASQTTVYFMFIGKPGVEFAVASGMDVYVEPDLGIFNSTFLFIPTVGIKFKL